MTRILVFGASAERGYWDFEGGWVHRLQQDLDEYSWENDDDYSIYNLGVSGHTSQDILERIKAELQARQNSEEMQVLLRVTGVNDSLYNLETGKNLVSPEKYRENLSKIVDIAKKYTAREVLIGGTPIDQSRVDPVPWRTTHAYRTDEIKRYRDKRIEMANDRGLDLMELRPYIDEEDWRANKLKDGIHPNMGGHKQIYRIIKDGLKEREMIPKSV